MRNVFLRPAIMTCLPMRSGDLSNHRPECMYALPLTYTTSLISPSFSFGVVGCPSDGLALSNCLIVHPSDFPQGQHVLVKQAFPLTTR